MPHLYLRRTGSPLFEIVYVVGYWANTLDPIQLKQISTFLTTESAPALREDSLLVGRGDLEAIEEESIN